MRLPTPDSVPALQPQGLPRDNINVKNTQGLYCMANHGASGGPSEGSYFKICNRRDRCVRVRSIGRCAETQKFCWIVWCRSFHRTRYSRSNYRCEWKDVCSHGSSFHDRGSVGFLFIRVALFLADAAGQIKGHASYAVGAGILAGVLHIDLVLGSEIELS
jgi:hypothetical protein